MTDDDFELDTAPTSPVLESTPALSTTQPKEDQENVVDVGALNLDLGAKAVDVSSEITQSQEQTRAKIAWTFTQIFLLLVIGALILPTIINIGFPGTFADTTETTKTLLTAVASILAGPFGFIVGFYFKEKGQE